MFYRSFKLRRPSSCAEEESLGNKLLLKSTYFKLKCATDVCKKNIQIG